MVTGVRRAARLLGTALGLAALISMAGLAAAQAPWTAPAGEKEKNLTLTQARAMVVREYLTNRFRVDDARIKTKGMGEDAQTDSRKASRVEILVYTKGAGH